MRVGPVPMAGEDLPDLCVRVVELHKGALADVMVGQGVGADLLLEVHDGPPKHGIQLLVPHRLASGGLEDHQVGVPVDVPRPADVAHEQVAVADVSVGCNCHVHLGVGGRQGLVMSGRQVEPVALLTGRRCRHLRLVSDGVLILCRGRGGLLAAAGLLGHELPAAIDVILVTRVDVIGSVWDGVVLLDGRLQGDGNQVVAVVTHTDVRLQLGALVGLDRVKEGL
mmetsp:Transcript_38672/g.110594  ORF Transcript_38672/g.110594 Transcript_38672/m.110594 type:complete len:224 (-) Transcript_38672:618-1289(-)